MSDVQYSGSDGYKLLPEAGWAGSSGDWRYGLALNAQIFPGTKGAWFGSLPAPLQQRALTLVEDDYATVEARASLGWKIVTLSVSRSLSDYLGLSANEAGPLGTRVLDSKGTTYVALDLDWPMTDALTLSAGAGRLKVPNFDGLGYSDWRLGIALQAWQLRWVLSASGLDNRASTWRVASRQGSDEASTVWRASVAWSF